MNRIMYIVSLIWLSQATAFSTVPPRMTMMASSSVTKKNWFSVFSSSKDSELSRDGVMRQLEKQEADLQKRRLAAMEELSKYEANLEALQSKKAEYMASSQIAEPPAGGSFSETALRSVVKSFCWRIVAGSVTFITTLQFSGSLQTALKVVASDFFSKSVTMFIGERLMNKSQVGRKKGSDDAGRSLAKALIWRLFAIVNTLAVAIFVSHDLSIAGKIASTDAVFKTALMYFYERVWARVEWGKEYIVEFTI
ncbi:hypothetical protein FisN_6Hh247 [Fistulifera solaris]|uniref:DUF2061 domain-containing protein n=1 Tax=Fistulifera solaris TaxID=1519565 RepID=A0A1Z5K7C9_FISSO|nr:hypothetical protein FisN_6Hh247 [Fistulifera solaris]|eukprot:GAX22001.1 hypothetical protein FisN_6Hh247 [Fistulifera solaris]